MNDDKLKFRSDSISVNRVDAIVDNAETIRGMTLPEPANVKPREWAREWRIESICSEGDTWSGPRLDEGELSVHVIEHSAYQKLVDINQELVRERDALKAELKSMTAQYQLKVSELLKDRDRWREIAGKLAEALGHVDRCNEYCPEHLGANDYKDPGVAMAQEIIESMRETAREALAEYAAMEGEG